MAIQHHHPRRADQYTVGALMIVAETE